MTDWLGPDEDWPQHGRPLARAALRDAARAGWSFRKSSGHGFGTLACPALGQPGACRKPVFSTSGPADGSATAREIKRALRSCPHRVAAEAVSSEADEALDDDVVSVRIERLLAAADGLARRKEALRAAEHAIERDDPADLNAQVLRMDMADNRASVAFTELGLAVEPWPPAIGRGELLQEARRMANGLSDPRARRRAFELIDEAGP